METENDNNVTQGLLQPNKARKVKNNSCLFALCNYKSYEQFVTSKQMEELNGLVSEAKMKADPDSENTKEMLLDVYKNVYPGSPLPEMISEEWKTMGFQSENPTSDLRSSGQLSLENIHYFSDHHQSSFTNLVNSTKDYPLIASAFNITTMLLIHLHIYTNYTFCPCCGTSFKTVKKVPLKEMAAFAFLLEENSWQTVFNELFSIGVVLMDHNYRKMVATDPSFTILEFRKVFVETKNQLLAILRKKPYSVNDIFTLATPFISS